MSLALAMTFGCGALYELGCVFWVHYAEEDRAVAAAIASCIAAFVTCIGLGEALHRPRFIAAYVLGFGFGTWAGVALKRRLR